MRKARDSLMIALYVDILYQYFDAEATAIVSSAGSSPAHKFDILVYWELLDQIPTMRRTNLISVWQR